jgi:SAM-dependent methyltransferase
MAAGSAEALPFESGTFEVILLVDVLEHVADDSRALGEVSRLLAPGGYAVFSVPAYQFLFGEHDRSFGHLRRYTRPRLVELLSNAGLLVQRATYIQPFFLLPLWVKRKLTKGSHDFGQIPGWLNTVLYKLLSMERMVLRYLNFPFGPTLIAIAQKPKG